MREVHFISCATYIAVMLKECKLLFISVESNRYKE